jgi:hypothetical protein
LASNLYNNWDDPGKVLDTAVDQFKHGAIENQIGQSPKLRDVLNNQGSMTPEQFAEVKDELVKIFNDNGVDVKDITLYTNAEGRQAFYTKDADGNRDTVALGIINQLTGQQLTGNELTGLMHYETTDHASGKETIDGYANEIGLYGQESRDFFNTLRFTDYTDDSGLDRSSYNDAYGNHSLIQQGNYLASTTSPKDTSNLAWGKLSPDGTKLRITGVILDGNTALKDEETGEVVADFIFDHTIIKTNQNGKPVGTIVGNTINLDIDITDVIDTYVRGADKEALWTWAGKSMPGEEYDIKNVLGGDHHDGYIYQGKIITAQGAGDLMFGRNAENEWLIPNDFLRMGAGAIHWTTNHGMSISEYTKYNNLPTTMGETTQANQYIMKGIQEQRDINMNNFFRRLGIQ